MSYVEPGRKHVPIEQTSVYLKLVELSNWAWGTARSWDTFARDTLGKQLVRACDSVAANLVEADGRFTQNDALRLLIIARGSARETAHWFRLTRDRELVDQSVIEAKIVEWNSACRELNGLIGYRRNNPVVKENRAHYGGEGEQVSDEMVEWLLSWPRIDATPE